MMVNLWWFMVNSDIKLIQRQQQSGYLGDGSYMVLWILQGIHLSDIQDKPWAMGRQWSVFSKLLYLHSCQAKRPPRWQAEAQRLLFVHLSALGSTQICFFFFSECPQEWIKNPENIKERAGAGDSICLWYSFKSMDVYKYIYM